MSTSDNTPAKHGAAPPWQPGQSGNPAGRPKGAKNKLAEDFVADVHAAWQEHGKAAIDAMIADKPGDFVKTVASLIPKETTLHINDYSEMTDDELAQRVRHLAAQLAPFLNGRDGTGSGDLQSQEGAAITARVH